MVDTFALYELKNRENRLPRKGAWWPGYVSNLTFFVTFLPRCTDRGNG